jgi:hypothetical protein
MTKTLREIKTSDVQKLFDSRIYYRGEEYFEEGLVKSVDLLDSSTLSGIVKGNSNYKVSISIDSDEDLSCECSCPCDFNCKHAAALLLKWLSIKDDLNEPKNSKQQKKESITDILSRKSKDELIELLKEFLIKHPEMKQFVKLDKKEISLKIKSLFSDFIDWDEVSDLISQLETILEGIKRNKPLWNKELLSEIEKCSIIMVNGQENMHDEGDIGLFLEKWFLLFGEMFSSFNPTIQEKREFLQKIIGLSNKDQYGLESSYEKAFLGMCKSIEDIELIKEYFKPTNKDKYEDKDYYTDFYLDLYDKLGLNNDYLSIAKKEGFSSNIVDKLVSLGRLEEALEEINKIKTKSYTFWNVKTKKLEILKKLGRSDEYKKLLFEIIIIHGDINDAIMLKKESKKEEWKGYLKQIISDAQKKERESFISKVYFHEEDYNLAYEYSKKITDQNYLELLAKKLSTKNPMLSCEIYTRLCFMWIDSGSGWPYKKAGKMLEAIKRLDKQGKFYNDVKNKIMSLHKKKYSLMEIIRNV